MAYPKLTKIQTDSEPLNRVQDAWLGVINPVLAALSAPTATPSPARSVPVATLLPFAGSAAPTGFLLCNGAAVSRRDYPDLFTAIGTTYGVGDGSTTFNVPDLRSRLPVGAGQGSGLANRALAATGGVEAVTLTAAQSGLPSHAHTVTDAGHSHVDGFAGVNATAAFGVSTTGVAGNVNSQSGTSTANHANTSTATTGVTVDAAPAAAAGSSHENMPPFLAVNWIIAT